MNDGFDSGHRYVYDRAAQRLYLKDRGALVPLGQAARALSFVQEVNLGGDGAISITGIPATFTHLILFGTLRSARAVVLDNVRVTINNDAGANYDYCNTGGTNATSSTGSAVAANFLNGTGIGNSAAANVFASLFMVILNYTAVMHHPTLMFTGDVDVAVANAQAQMQSGKWRSTVTPNRFDFADGAAGTTFKALSRVAVAALR